MTVPSRPLPPPPDGRAPPAAPGGGKPCTATRGSACPVRAHALSTGYRVRPATGGEALPFLFRTTSARKQGSSGGTASDRAGPAPHPPPGRPEPGPEVVPLSVSFAAAHTIAATGARPVFCPVGPAAPD
ncbi:hypothetical protein FNX48_010550, partial [Streptomyces sp. IF17]|nr:hypothetical protein [Streptomyces alkaliphilus]